jgi:hypothetical protein
MPLPDAVMPRLDLGISWHKVGIPASRRWLRVGSTAEVTLGDTKIKSWYDECFGIRLCFAML